MLVAISACGGGATAETPTVLPTIEAQPTVEETAVPAEDVEEEAAEEVEAEVDATAVPAEEAEEEAAEEVDATAVPEEEAAEEAEAATPIRVVFLQPSNNAIIPITSTVIMTATGVTVAPAGEVAEGQVHLHILIDTPFIEAGNPIPNDDQHLHYGDGSTTTDLALPVGSHTLRLQAADGAHVALAGDEYRDEIVVEVTEDAAAQAVRIAMPVDGETVPPTFEVTMAATGLIVEPAGPINANAGHFHILIDTEFIEPGLPIPADEAHLHFGKGQLTTTLTLEPGDHLLRLQMADGAHVALEGDQYRDEITVTVAE